MRPLNVRPLPRLRCRKCGSTNIHLVGKIRRALKAHHQGDYCVQCFECKHHWYSKSRAAAALYQPFLELAGQRVITWDEMPLKKPLTRPPLPE